MHRRTGKICCETPSAAAPALLQSDQFTSLPTQ